MSFKIYSFGLGEEVTETSKEVLGGKGAGLVWMTQHDYPVPPGFVIPTDIWTRYNLDAESTMILVAEKIKPYLAKLHDHFGYHPLLSVRSGARVSMPGMMDTILNVGLDGESEPFWFDKLGKQAFIDSRNRLHDMYAKTVGKEGIVLGTLPTAMGQLLNSIEAVFKSWNSDRAKTYRELNNIPTNWGTAVVVQAMVFGNLNDQSATGVLFTRNPDTGEKHKTGEFLVGAQGEDIVAGTHTPKPLHPDMVQWSPHASGYLFGLAGRMEAERNEVQDIEFTVEDGKLYLLQCRTAKRTARAALKITLDFLAEGRITAAEAVQRITARDLDTISMVTLDPSFTDTPDYTGLGASAGVVTGIPVFSSAEALLATEPCILITQETTPNDVAGMNAAIGVITMKGGITAHAAVVARGMNKPAIVGVGAKLLTKFKKAPVVSMDGSTGNIWFTKVPTLAGETGESVAAIHSLVFSQAKAIPILTEVPQTFLPEALLTLTPEEVFSSEATAGRIREYSHKVGTLYVDLDEALLLSPEYFGVFLNQERKEEIQHNRLASIFVYPYPNKVIALTTVKGNSEVVMNTNPSLEELITLPEAVVSRLDLNNAAVSKVLAWRAGEIKLVSVGQTHAAADKTFLSFPQALAALHSSAAYLELEDLITSANQTL